MRWLSHSRSHAQYVLVVVLTLMVGAAALLGDLVEGRSLSSVGILTAGVLMGVALVGALGVLRLSALGERLGERARHDRALVNTARRIAAGDQTAMILQRLVEQTVSVLGVERAVVFVADESDPQVMVVAAGHGVPPDFIGRRVGSDEGMVGQVLRTGEPALAAEYASVPRPIQDPAVAGIHAAGAVPIRWNGRVRGALGAGSVEPGRTFAQREIEVLCQLADLGAVALDQADMRVRLQQALEAGVETLAAATGIRDNYTGQHAEAVVELAAAVGTRLGLDPEAVARLRLAARLHDVGKIGVPDAILRKPGPLDAQEWQLMKQHPVWGAELLARVPGLEEVAQVVRAEHEHWDGSGYPTGLQGSEIPLASRIILACDAYHAMISDRPYRKAMPAPAAIEELQRGAGTQFDPTVVDALITTLQDTTAQPPDLAPAALR